MVWNKEGLYVELGIKQRYKECLEGGFVNHDVAHHKWAARPTPVSAERQGEGL
jgi:hypothetical protein